MSLALVYICIFINIINIIYLYFYIYIFYILYILMTTIMTKVYAIRIRMTHWF